jgi:hypothetical protein
MKKELPIGISTFAELIQENYVYVDKTEIIYQLVSRKKYYFLHRPRRFGKSLLISTLSEIFKSNKQLFDGLAIAALPYAWKKHPVIMISFASIAHTSPETLNNGIKLYLQGIAQDNQIILKGNLLPGEMLKELVAQMAKHNSVVLLIDEYDYPILQNIHKKEVAHEVREALKNFYSVIKDLDKNLRFVFFTGVSKFSQTSIFSGLNNLEDISLDEPFNTLLGYTRSEIITYFPMHLEETAQTIDYPVEKLLENITDWYDGYLFTGVKNSTKIYNPFSVLLFLSKKRFSNYWFQTATPTFLINLLKLQNYPIQDFEHIEATESELGAFDIDTLPLKTLLFQTGYVTIQSYHSETGNYLLAYPNRETRNSFIEYIFASITHQSGIILNNTAISLLKSFVQLDFDQVKKIVTSFFASVPYGIHIGEEKYYQTIFYIVLKIIGATIVVEEQTNIGRIDAVLETKDNYFIIEFKITSAAKALEQIENRKYYQAYEELGKKIILVGIAFDTVLKNVSEIEYREITE